MYRVFCESYENFQKTFEKENYRLNISKIFDLITNIDKFNEEKEKHSDLYIKLCNLLTYMQDNIDKFPKFKAFLWTLKSRNIIGRKYINENIAELEEQAKLVNSFLKLVYWY